MQFRGKPLAQVTEADLLKLGADQVEEGKLIDYKRDLPKPGTDEKKEFLHDVVSFANTAGGHLVFGIEEKDRVPFAIPGVSPDSMDKVVLQLDSWVRDQIEPRIVGFQIHPVKLAAGPFVLILQIPRSWVGPHMVKATYKFYARNSGGKFPLDVGEIRSAFIGSESVTQRVESFRAERLAKILSKELGIKPEGQSQVVLHVCPLVSFAAGFEVDLKKVATREDLRCQPAPVGLEFPAVSPRFTFDGRLLPCFGNEETGTAGASSLLFRNGCIETWNSHLVQPDYRGKALEYGVVEGAVNAALRSYFSLLMELNVDPPWVVMLSLLNVRDYFLARRSGLPLMTKPIDRDHLVLPEVIVEDNQILPEIAMRSAYDVLWNACGMMSCFLYDKDGKWKG